MNWRIHHKAETQSTNLDARGGSHGDVFTAEGGEPHSVREWGSLKSLDDYADFFTDYLAERAAAK